MQMMTVKKFNHLHLCLYVIIFTFPKILGKTCLKSMLCLFWRCCAFFVFLILGIGKSFKINELQVFWAWRGWNSQKFEKERGAGWAEG